MKILISFVLFFIATPLFAQELVIPAGLSLETPKDYKDAEELVLKSIQWLQETPVDENAAKRKEINAFLMKWLTGSPSVSIELVSGFIVEECPDCLMVFMGGWTQYSLQHQGTKDKVACAVAGLESMIVFYENNKSVLGTNRDIKRLKKRMEKGQLREFASKQFGK